MLTKSMSQRNCVKPVTVGRMIIVAAAANRRKTRCSIHVDGWISLTNFQMNVCHCVLSSPFQKIVEQLPPDASAMATGNNREQQQLGFVGDGPA